MSSNMLNWDVFLNSSATHSQENEAKRSCKKFPEIAMIYVQPWAAPKTEGRPDKILAAKKQRAKKFPEQQIAYFISDIFPWWKNYPAF